VGVAEGLGVNVTVGVGVAEGSVGAIAVSVCTTAVCSAGLRVAFGVLPLQAEANNIIVRKASKKPNLFLIILILQALLYCNRLTPI